jgi:hypothetical protein
MTDRAFAALPAVTGAEVAIHTDRRITEIAITQRYFIDIITLRTY